MEQACQHGAQHSSEPEPGAVQVPHAEMLFVLKSDEHVAS